MFTESFKFINLPKEQISTRTMIISTNLVINTELLFQNLPVVEVQLPYNIKKKEKVVEYVCNQSLNEGDIIYVEYTNLKRGNFFTKKTKKKYFRNSLTLIMFIDGKCVNFKLPHQGRIQMTGIKKQEHSEKCILHLWRILNNIKVPNIWYLSNGDNLSVIFRTVMTNINFALGFGINRQLLDMYINKKTPFNSLLETSFGYTGINVKIPYTLDLDEKLYTITLINNNIVKGYITQNDYINTLTEKEQKKERTKKRYNTFLIFYSGTGIMSGMSCYYMQDIYEKFMKTIYNAKNIIQE